MKYFYGLQGWLCQTKISREVLKEHTTKAMEQMILERIKFRLNLIRII